MSTAAIEIIAALTASPKSAIAQCTNDPAARTLPDGTTFPLFLQPKRSKADGGIALVDLQQYIRTHAAHIRRAASLFVAVVFNDCEDVMSPNDFGTLLSALGLKPMQYIGGAAVRRVLVGREEPGEVLTHTQVLTTNESPPSEAIPFHCELAQTTPFPDHISFCCMEMAGEGGTTPLCRADVVYDWLAKNHPAFLQQLAAKGVQYYRTVNGHDDAANAQGRTWRSMFKCQTKEEAEAAAAKQGSTLRWNNDAQESCVVISEELPAVRVASSGGKSFMNQIPAAYFGWRKQGGGVTFADGEKLDDATMVALHDYMNSVACRFVWKQGRFVIVDNTMCFHAREPFTAVGRRRVIASIAKGVVDEEQQQQSSSMNYVTLTTGYRQPMVGFGCWKVPNDACADIIYKAIKAALLS